MQDMKTINLTSAETLSINRGSETTEAVAKTKCHIIEMLSLHLHKLTVSLSCTLDFFNHPAVPYRKMRQTSRLLSSQEKRPEEIHSHNLYK